VKSTNPEMGGLTVAEPESVKTFNEMIFFHLLNEIINEMVFSFVQKSKH
jgi:hypothetical protein